MKKTITKNLILIGGGRWAKIYLEELLKKKIFIYLLTSNNNLKKFFIKHNFHNYKFIKKLNEVNIDNKYYLILINKTEKRLKFIKKIINLKNQILIEKPLTNNPNDYFKYKLNKKNTYLSLQFYFAIYFASIKKEIKNEKIEYLKVDWFDNKNEKKNFNKKINFIEDSFYHFFSIVRIFIKSTRLINDNSIIKKTQIKSNFKNIQIILNSSKNSYNKKRILFIKTNKNEYTINFKNLNAIYIKKNKNKKIKITKNIKNITIQIDNFLDKKNIIKKNSLHNLKYLFKDLIQIKNQLT